MGCYFKIVIVAALSASLYGCATEQPANPEQFQKLGETCQKYGFKPGSDQFAACIYQLDQQRIADNRQRRMAAAMAMQGMSNSFNANAAAMNQQAIANRQVNCTSTPGMNGVVRTACY